MRMDHQAGLSVGLAVVLAAGTLSAMEKIALDGLWDFRFEKGKIFIRGKRSGFFMGGKKKVLPYEGRI